MTKNVSRSNLGNIAIITNNNYYSYCGVNCTYTKCLPVINQKLVTRTGRLCQGPVWRGVPSIDIKEWIGHGLR